VGGPPRTGLELGAALACVVLGLWAYRGALGAYFSPDDFILLEKARGLLPNPVTAWRFLSGAAYFGATGALFGAHPFPYHLVNWLLHGLNVGLLFALVRSRGAGVPAAALAAGLFAASRLFLSAVYPVTGVGELLALALTLSAFLAASRAGVRAGVGDRGVPSPAPRTSRLRGNTPAADAGTAGPTGSEPDSGASSEATGSRSRRGSPAVGFAAPWPAISFLLFAAALLCKENVALLPLVLLVPAPADGGLGARVRRAVPLLGVGVVMLAYLAAGHVRTGSLGGEAYAMGFGANLAHNFMTYCAWAVDLVRSSPDAAGRMSHTAWRVGGWVVAVWVVVAALAWRRSALPVLGAAWWVLSLGLVLPLLHHTNLYYLYTPWAGLAMAAGGALEAVAGVRRARWAWVASAVLVIAHAGLSARLLDARLGARIQGVDLPADPYLRKCEMARNAVTDAGPGLRGEHLRVVLIAPGSKVQYFDAATGRALVGARRGARSYNPLEDCLDQGRALRLVYPSVDSVVFLTRVTQDHAGFDLFAYNSEGHLMSLGRGPRAHQALVEGMLQFGFQHEALEHLSMVVRLYPEDAALRYVYALQLGRAGRSDEGVAQLREIVRRGPSGPADAEAVQQARALLARVAP
jgi:hypothetical protein